MSSTHLIKAFADRTVLPVDLNDVTQWLLDRGHQDEIHFIPVELDTGVIRGFLKRFRIRAGALYSEHRNVSHIYYDEGQGEDWIQMVCAKELLHILDAARCSSKEEFDRLTGSLALPNEAKHLLSDPTYALVDKVGSVAAAALLLPMAAREALLPVYKTVLTDADIAKLAVMPIHHVRLVMSDDWPMIYEAVLSIGK